MRGRSLEDADDAADGRTHRGGAGRGPAIAAGYPPSRQVRGTNPNPDPNPNPTPNPNPHPNHPPPHSSPQLVQLRRAGVNRSPNPSPNPHPDPNPNPNPHPHQVSDPEIRQAEEAPDRSLLSSAVTSSAPDLQSLPGEPSDAPVDGLSRQDSGLSAVLAEGIEEGSTGSPAGARGGIQRGAGASGGASGGAMPAEEAAGRCGMI